VFKIIPERKISVGKPRKRWLNDDENDLKRMGVRRKGNMVWERDAWKLDLKLASVLQMNILSTKIISQVRN
jgi:hypothetical protein